MTRPAVLFSVATFCPCFVVDWFVYINASAFFNCM